MKLLLDTHIFIWSDESPERIPQHILSAMEDVSNELVLSVASVWEMQIKVQIGKLKLQLPLQEMVAQALAEGMTVVSVDTKFPAYPVKLLS